MASTPRPVPTARSTAAEGTPRASLAALFGVFATIALSSFGGGQKAQIRRACVSRGWLTDQEFIEALELAEVMPGANIVNLAVYVGARQRGPAGALVALLAGTVPPFFIVLAAGWWYLSPYNTPFTHRVLTGCAVGAIGLTVANALELTADQRSQWSSLAIVAAVAVLVGAFRLHLLPTLVFFGGLGIVLYELRRRQARP
ncbi:MAG: chromate transporter [Vulcanimicrobiaceae bacterium]